MQLAMEGVALFIVNETVRRAEAESEDSAIAVIIWATISRLTLYAIAGGQNTASYLHKEGTKNCSEGSSIMADEG